MAEDEDLLGLGSQEMSDVSNLVAVNIVDMGSSIGKCDKMFFDTIRICLQKFINTWQSNYCINVLYYYLTYICCILLLNIIYISYAN